jgi:hypothetical protein
MYECLPMYKICRSVLKRVRTFYRVQYLVFLYLYLKTNRSIYLIHRWLIYWKADVHSNMYIHNWVSQASIWKTEVFYVHKATKDEKIFPTIYCKQKCAGFIHRFLVSSRRKNQSFIMTKTVHRPSTYLIGVGGYARTGRHIHFNRNLLLGSILHAVDHL